jgi:electron transfer flavoprotein beta subunit
MPYHCIVLAKQVPDTKTITGQAMREDGTVNRAALPAIFNPEDLNALELALELRDRFGGRVTLISMGPPAACELLREALYRGADEAILLTDRRFAAADTLATSYALSCAIGKIGPFDLVIAGRQAIDGDTAQVGPQTAEKLGINQVTYVEKVLKLDGRTIELERAIEGGFERVRAPLPLLLTVTGAANEPRPPRAKRLLQYRHYTAAPEIAERVRKQIERSGRTPTDAEVAAVAAPLVEAAVREKRTLTHWDADAVNADAARIGGRGSPTKVKKIESIVLKGRDLAWIEPTEEGLRALVKGLVEEHILG